MAFQFLCPQGHLLQGDPSQMGAQCQCPYCGILFIIPTVPQQVYAPGGVVGPGHAAPAEPGFVPDFAATAGPSARQELGDFLGRLEQVEPKTADPALDFTASAGAAPRAPAESFPLENDSAAEPAVLHIPCPNGHELESPLDMLGQEVLCPHCGVQFLLRREDSREHRAALDRKYERRGKLWFQWAVAAVVVVMLGIGLLIALSVSGR